MEVALIVLDGWGIGPADDSTRRNAIAEASTPNMDRYQDTGETGRLTASGSAVGLPGGQMGNSEVGHLNIGAGRIVFQDYTRINEAIERAQSSADVSKNSDIPDPPLDENPAILEALAHVKDTNGTVHLMGLLSDGGVHSDIAHFIALIDLAAANDADAVTHAFTDGRDTDPTAGVDYISEIQETIAEHDTGHIASVIGRYFAMDRDENWERTHRAYQTLVESRAERMATDPVAALHDSYKNGVTDEFVEPIWIKGGESVSEGDAVVFVNFRSDRARQLTRMLAAIHPADWENAGISIDSPSTHITTMTEYDRTFSLPVAFEPLTPEKTLGATLAEHSYTQVRIAESEKYPHVTYFLNGGREITYGGEHRHIVSSPDVPTYDLAPEMSAREVTDSAIASIQDTDPTVLILNYANPDMVGHTGDFDATVTAVETVDSELHRLVRSIQEAGATVLITADHGNADDMGSASAPHTAHTTNPVPFIALAPNGKTVSPIRSDGILADIAPTILSLLGCPQPPAMTGTSLFE